MHPHDRIYWESVVRVNDRYYERSFIRLDQRKYYAFDKFNTYKVLMPNDEDIFTQIIPIVWTHTMIWRGQKQKTSTTVINQCPMMGSYFIGNFIEWTDYTLLVTKNVSVHHLN